MYEYHVRDNYPGNVDEEAFMEAIGLGGQPKIPLPSWLDETHPSFLTDLRRKQAEAAERYRQEQQREQDGKERKLRLQEGKLALRVARTQPTDDPYDDLGAGIGGRQRWTPSVIEQVEAACPFIRDTRATGGADHDEPRWKLTISLATYFGEKSRQLAHEFSQGHDTYDPDETDEKFDQAEKDKESNPNLGPPKCTTIHETGATQCATCPHLKLDRSPLNVPGAYVLPAGIFPDIVDLNTGKYQPMPGGRYTDCEENIKRLNERYSMVRQGSDAVWHEDRGPLGLETMKDETLKKELANIKIRKGDDVKPIDCFNWFMNHPHRLPAAQPIFKFNLPPGRINTDDFNMCMGWGEQPNASHDWKLQIIGNHIRVILCRGIPDRHLYLMRLIAWTFQHPEQPCEVVLVLQGPIEGTGKNMIADMMVHIFGKHGAVFGDKNSLLGEHAVNEYQCFLVLDETLFHRDKQTADKLKHIITGRDRTINPKYQDQRSVPNRLSIWILSNHEIVLPVGGGARRLVIFEVSRDKVDNNTPEKEAANSKYFTRLHEAIYSGGAGQFLDWCLKAKLPPGWHPRQIPHTEELAKHQRAAMPAGYRWLAIMGSEIRELTGAF
jgi:hypothetical protein